MAIPTLGNTTGFAKGRKIHDCGKSPTRHSYNQIRNERPIPPRASRTRKIRAKNKTENRYPKPPQEEGPPLCGFSRRDIMKQRAADMNNFLSPKVIYLLSVKVS